MAKIIFITGTGTGVGKTVLTALLLHHLRESGCHALAMKPFCSGSRADARLLLSLQKNLLTLDEVNPFFFKQPVAPLAARDRRKTIRLDSVLGKIRVISGRCDVLLVEGIGGLLVPLGKNYSVADVISKLDCSVLVAAPNRLGTINHTLLTANALETVVQKGFKIILMDDKRPDFSAKSNPKTLKKLRPNNPIISIPNFGKQASRSAIVKINAKKIKKTLAQIL